jgi:hypothetical protein
MEIKSRDDQTMQNQNKYNKPSHNWQHDWQQIIPITRNKSVHKEDGTMQMKIKFLK